MPPDMLEITLKRRQVERAQTRRHFIARTLAGRPRLSRPLRQLGAVGPVLHGMPASGQKAFVKVVITDSGATAGHLGYLQRGKGPAQTRAPLFGPQAETPKAFAQAAQQDPHQFRLIVQVYDQPGLDRTQFITLFMAQVERDLGRPLAWVAAHHFDTDDPHTHIALRGRDRQGKDLYVERHYLLHAMRVRAAEVLTALLGPLRQQTATLPGK